MELYPTFVDPQMFAVYHYFSSEFPQLIHYVENLLNEGYSPADIENFAEAKIGVCETSYSVKIIAYYLILTN
jgi:hypothetical protein